MQLVCARSSLSIPRVRAMADLFGEELTSLVRRAPLSGSVPRAGATARRPSQR
jgi:hypothetical protein